MNRASAPTARRTTVLITGAAGNLGGLLARHMLPAGYPLRLMFHKTPLAPDITSAANVVAVQADLAAEATLPAAVKGADVVVHFAGVLFAPRPARFLPETNTPWFGNLLDACVQACVDRVVLISFPHVEGPTSVEHPARGRSDGRPVSVHAQTRLEEERMLLSKTIGTATTPVVLRLGMVYGREILMIKTARWLAKHHLLGVWREPTWIHLLSTEDYLIATEAAIVKPNVGGIYHVGDEQPVTLQQFLDAACRVWGFAPPHRMPIWSIMTAATLCEMFATITGSASPLTRDFIRIGRVSYWGDTRRAREDLIPTLVHPTLESGLSTL